MHLPSEKKNAFNDEIRELLAIEVDVNSQPLDLSKLGDINISVVDLLSLEPFTTSSGG